MNLWIHFMEIHVTVLKTDKNSNLDHKICCLFDTVVISTLECPRCLCTYSHLCTQKHVGLKMICGQVHCWQTKTCCDEFYWAQNANANLETRINSTVYWKKQGDRVSLLCRWFRVFRGWWWQIRNRMTHTQTETDMTQKGQGMMGNTEKGRRKKTFLNSNGVVDGTEDWGRLEADSLPAEYHIPVL